MVESVAGAGLGMIGDLVGGAIQQGRTKKLMGMQQQNQKELNRYNQELNMKMWRDTNYSAQMQEMEKAGLNPGLMYGMSGGSGGTTGSAGGSAAMGSTPQSGNMGMTMIQAQLAQSQIEVQKSQAEKNRAEANAISGVNTENTKANTALTQMQTENQKIINNVQGQTIDEQIDGIKANADKAQSEARSALVGANVNEETKDDQVKQIKQEAINAALEAGVKQMNINVGQAQIKNMAEQIAIGKFNANTNAEYQGVDKVSGGALNKLINLILKTFGAKEFSDEMKNTIK